MSARSHGFNLNNKFKSSTVTISVEVCAVDKLKSVLNSVLSGSLSLGKMYEIGGLRRV